MSRGVMLTAAAVITTAAVMQLSGSQKQSLQKFVDDVVVVREQGEEVYPGVVVKRDGPWFLGTCTGTKGSGAWLREWIELQLISGVDHLWIVNDNNISQDDITTGILGEYVRLGYVTVIPGKMPLKHPGCKIKGNLPGEHNCAAVKHCFEHAAPHVQWLLFADSDEFIFPRYSCSLREHLQKRCDPDSTHVLLRWERFGSSGHDIHPSGLIIENFLTSGGDCSTTTYPSLCGAWPYLRCGECRHSKLIFNTDCVNLDHAGWPHWLTNTTDWKERKRRRFAFRRWQTSDGPDANFKKPQCKYRTDENDTRSCQLWLRRKKSAVRSKKGLSKKCCSAGIGYNHYGTKSRQYYLRKQVTSKVSKRGLRIHENAINLSGTLSTDVLRFLRAVRHRLAALGHPISDNVRFVDPSSTPPCFVESNYIHTPLQSTAQVTVTSDSLSRCCAACHGDGGCKSFVYRNSSCTLLIGAKWVAGAKVPVAAYHLYAEREKEMTAKAGVPLRYGECGR